MESATDTSRLQRKTLNNTVGLGVALGVNVLLLALTLLVYFSNKACLSVCAARGSTICGVQKNRRHIYSILNFILFFVLSRVVMVFLRLCHYIFFPPSGWNIVDGLGRALFAVTESVYVMVFSSVILLWIMLVKLMNKDGRVPVAVFVVAQVILVITNLVIAVACLMAAVTFCIPQQLIGRWYTIVPAYIVGPTLIVGFIVLDVLTIFLLLLIVIRLKKDLSFKYSQETFSEEAAKLASMQNTLATRMMIIMVVLGLTLCFHLLGIVALGLDVDAWIITLFLQTIPDLLSIGSILWLFVPLRRRSTAGVQKPTETELSVQQTVSETDTPTGSSSPEVAELTIQTNPSEQ